MKTRTHYHWKLKEKEIPEILEWFENQENISNSLRSILYHTIELYGTGDFLDPSIQREIVKDSLRLEALKKKHATFDTDSVLLDNESGAISIPSEEKEKTSNLVEATEGQNTESNLKKQVEDETVNATIVENNNDDSNNVTQTQTDSEDDSKEDSEDVATASNDDDDDDEIANRINANVL